jgi:4-hydroxybenzoate polyprenyltransferase
MALNDYADREVDAVERPRRPIPSGRVQPRTALSIASGLTAAGLAIAGLAGGRRALGVAVPLAGTIWAYDMVLKSTPAGPVVMAAARSLDVLLGAGGQRAAAPAAAVMGAHTLAVTVLSRSEVEGASPVLPAAALVATGGVCLAAGRVRPSPSAAKGPRAWAGKALFAGYAAGVGSAQLAAVKDPTPGPLQRAVGAGIMGMIPLQAALIARAGSARSALLIAAAYPLARRLSRRVSPT